MVSKSCLLFLLITGLFIQHISTEVVREERCENPTRLRCIVEYPTILKCDDTNYTVIPSKEDLYRFDKEHPHFIPPYKATIVHFNHSCIEAVHKDKIKEYILVESLDLRDNFIKVLRVNAFGNSKTLEKLFLSKNSIKKIEPGSFTNLKNLLHLHLGHNNLKEINSNTFSSLSLLQVLKLNNNKLVKISIRLFRDLTNLEELDLSENNLETFLPVHLKQLTNLKILNLKGNNLKNFNAKHALLASPNLNELNLNNNKITCLDDDAFDQHDLFSLRIANNPLKIPKKNWFSKLMKNDNVDHVIEMSHKGTWECNCNAYSYMEFLSSLQKSEDAWLDSLDVVCHNPLALRGKTLIELNWNQLKTSNNCSNPEPPGACSANKVIKPTPMSSTATTIATSLQRTTSSLAPTLTNIKKTFPESPESPESTNYLSINDINPEHSPQKQTSSSPISISKDILLYSIVAVVLIALIIVIFLVIYCKKKNSKHQELKPPSELPEKKLLRNNNSRKDTETTYLSDDDSHLVENVSETLKERGVGVGRSRPISTESRLQNDDETTVKEIIQAQSNPNPSDTVSNHTYQSVGQQSAAVSYQQFAQTHAPLSLVPVVHVLQPQFPTALVPSINGFHYPNPTGNFIPQQQNNPTLNSCFDSLQHSQNNPSHSTESSVIPGYMNATNNI